MNSRERYRAVTHYGKFDRVFRQEMGPYPETVKRWRSEGMPADQHLAVLAGYDRFETAPIHLGLLPTFEHETLKEDANYRTYRDSRDGVIKKIRKDVVYPAMPQYLEYPLKTREDWKTFREKLDPNSPARLPAHWNSLKNQYGWARPPLAAHPTGDGAWAARQNDRLARPDKNRDFPLGVSAGSMFGWLRDWMGVEHITVMLYDDPAWIHEMMEYLADHFVAVLKKVVFEVQFDFAVMWEDMAYKTASLISPKHVRELMMPNYRKITDLLHKAGVDVIMLDSDGNVEELIPLWLEVGINYIYPMEVAAGMDVVQLRRKFGRDLIIGGGMDKRVLAFGDRKAIDAMIDSKRDLILAGGYVPGCDHALPPDISWANFLYYREHLAQIA